MNFNEYKGSFLFRSLSSSSHSFISNTAKLKMFILTCNCQYTEFHISNFWSHQYLGRKLHFLSPLQFDFQTNSDHKPKKIKVYSDRAVKRYLNEKNLTHGRVMAMISKFSPQIFETHFIIDDWTEEIPSLNSCLLRCNSANSKSK